MSPRGENNLLWTPRSRLNRAHFGCEYAKSENAFKSSCDRIGQAVDSAPATVTVTVGAVNDVPVVADATMAVDEDGSGELTLTATDGDGDAITFAIGAATNGTAALDGDKVTYTPDANYNGTDSFTYTANDGTVDSAPATVTVTVAVLLSKNPSFTL